MTKIVWLVAMFYGGPVTPVEVKTYLIHETARSACLAQATAELASKTVVMKAAIDRKTGQILWTRIIECDVKASEK